MSTNFINSIQFNLFTCKLNSPEANYKASTSAEVKTQIQTKYKNRAIIIIIIIIIVIPLTTIKVKCKIYTFTYNTKNNKNNNKFKFNSLFLGFNTRATKYKVPDQQFRGFNFFVAHSPRSE
jgi:hypothetical protein